MGGSRGRDRRFGSRGKSKLAIGCLRNSGLITPHKAIGPYVKYVDDKKKYIGILMLAICVRINYDY